MMRETAGAIIGATWVVVAAPWALDAARGANADARGAVLAAWTIATAFGIASIVEFRRSVHLRRAGLFLLVSGLVMPTFAAVWLNLVPIAFGGFVALRSGTPGLVRYRPEPLDSGAP